ncbi:Phosphatidylglycerol/phosphatidylinositol transfer protein, variant 3 [Taiwanofungus camphoratus]|nr:Phosphatidylglycerol/phosphatidylinositol transfer protein, variant 3 [Antrodia cinnamomea]
MARRALMILLATAFSSVCVAKPTHQQEALLDVTHFKSDRWDWTDCGLSIDPVHIKSIEISPDPPVKGKDLTVTVIGTADKLIEDGAYADVVVKVGSIKLLQREFDVCAEARNANASLQCPVEEGRHEVTHTVTLPKEIPAGMFLSEAGHYSPLIFTTYSSFRGQHPCLHRRR